MNEQQQAPLTNEQLTEVLRLAKGADSVELKLTIPDAEHRSTAAALDMDLLEAQIRQVVFFDTPDLALYDRGVVVRARRVQRKGDDSVVKLRPVVPDHLSAGLRKTPGFGVEVDAMPGGFVCSASLKAALDRPHVRETLLGKGPVRRLFTKEQRAFYREHAPDGLELDDLSALGPLNVLKLRFSPTDFKRRVVAELWVYPDGSHILELSTKCRPDEAFQVAAEGRAFLSERGVNLAGEQATKTRTALEFFSRQEAETET